MESTNLKCNPTITEEAHGQSNHADMILSKINQFYAGEMYWDVQLQVGTQLFKCQRLLLAANSEYFQTMFNSDFKESNLTRDEPIILNEMDPTVFEELLNFMYTGDIRVLDSNVLQLLFMNDFFRLNSSQVKEQCLQYVKSRSQEAKPLSNALELLSFVFMKEENVFVDILSAHICQHLYHFSKDEQLMKFSFENLNTLLEFSKNFILPFPGCADVLVKIIYDWVSHNREERSQYRYKLMKNVDDANVSSKFALFLANTLANAVDEISKVSKNTKSLPDFKTLDMGIDIGLTDGDARHSATMSFNVKNVRDVQIGEIMYSSSSIISNLSWKTSFRRNSDYVHVYLHCDGSHWTSKWNCYGSAVITIKSHKEGGKDSQCKFDQVYLFSSEKNQAWGPAKFLTWNELVDPEKGYLEADGSITIETQVYADVPFLKMIQ